MKFPKLYQCNFYEGKRLVYDATLSFRNKPTEEDLQAFMRVGHPGVLFDRLEIIYLRDIEEHEL